MEKHVSDNNYSSYFEKYTDLLENKDVLSALKSATKSTKKIFKQVDESKALFAYAEGKWTINELVLHLIDTERILLYRALAFSRGEKALLPSFDEELYASNSNANNRSFKSIKKEFFATRKSSISFFKNLTPVMLQQKGRAAGNELSVANIGLIIAGHQTHHFTILKLRYLTQ